MNLLERESSLAQLSAIIDQTLHGSGSVVAILGEAGIGKTSLVQHAAADARPRLRVLTAGCEALFTPRPLGPLYDVASELGGDVDSLLGTSASRERLFPAVLAAIRREPTMLVVEDVHWADRATLDLLKYLARRVAHLPVVLVMTYREDEVGPEHSLITLIGDLSTPSLRRIRLAPLSESAVATLAAGSRRAVPDLYELTGGNPFFVTEVLSSDETGVPPTVRDAVLARAANLDGAARQVLEFAAIIPGHAELWLIAEALSPDPAVLEAAAESGIMRIDRDALVFRHELARRAVADSISELRRVRMHATILELLTRRAGPSLARLTHHAVGARDADAILRFAPQAGAEAAAADAHREAAAHYRLALAQASSLRPAERAALLDSLSYECYLTEQADEALQHRLAAFEVYETLRDTLRQGDNLRWQSRLLWFLGRAEEARDCARQAIEMLEKLPPGPELAMAWSNQSQLNMLAQEVDEAITWGNRAIELARRLDDEPIVAHALNNVGAAELMARTSGGKEKLEQSLRISLQRGFREHAARAYCNIATDAVRHLEYERARQYIDEGIAYCTERDLDAWGVYLLAWKARLLLEQGDWNGAAACATGVIRHHAVPAISKIPALAVLGSVRARRGDPGAASALDEAKALAFKTGEFQRIAPVACARAEAAWLRGDIEATAAEAREAFAVSSGMFDECARGELAFWMWRAGEIGEPPADIPGSYASQIAGDWRTAAAKFESLGRPYDVAVALADSDDPDALQRAAAILERLGSGTVLAAVRQKLRATGARVPRGPRESTRLNPAGLTEREMEILQLVDQGLRNADIAERLFVSQKTVGHHVSSILTKLGVRTRGEAARAVFRG